MLVHADVFCNGNCQKPYSIRRYHIYTDCTSNARFVKSIATQHVVTDKSLQATCYVLFVCLPAPLILIIHYQFVATFINTTFSIVLHDALIADVSRTQP